MLQPARLGILAAVLLLAGVTGPSDASSQAGATSEVRGRVLQDDGTPLPDADVALRHAETGVERSAATDEQGRFLFSLAQPGGPYVLTASHLGYLERRREGIRLPVGETVTVELVLRQDAIEVEGIRVEVDRADVFDPGRVGPSTLLDEVTVESMPIVSRDLMEMALLSPLVKTTEGGGFSVAGQNDRYNAVLVDGVLNQDLFGLTPGGVPGGQAGARILPLDAVSQYEVLVAPFDVRLSGFTGGVMNAVTRTGTNRWRVRGFGVHRNEALTGDLEHPTGATVEASGADRSIFGLSVGGPIVQDRGHFYVTGEFEKRRQPPAGYNLHRDDPLLVRISPEGMEAFRDVVESKFGLDPGRAGPHPLGRELANVFARLDWSFEDGNRLTVRNTFARATHDESPNRATFDPYGLSSNAVLRSSTSNRTSVQLFSDVGRRGSNELTLDVQHTTDATTPATSWPQMEVSLRSSVDGVGFSRAVRGGAEFFAQENDLRQASARLTNSLSLSRESSSFTAGVTGAYHSFRHRYLPGAEGDWFFASLEDLEANAPQRFQHTVLEAGEDPAVEFDVVEWGAFVQSELEPGDGLTLRFGLRVDMPHVLDRPPTNPEILDFFGHDTSRVPSGILLVSPRWGFNWQGGGERTTQLRGGAGLFAGQLPYIWLSNAFHNTGMRSFTRVCRGRRTDEPPSGNTAPPFTAGPQPADCLLDPPTEVRTVTVFEEDFRYPQDLKISLGVDQELTSSLTGSAGVLFSHVLDQVGVQELNLGGSSGLLGSLEGYGRRERRFLGDPSPRGFAPNREHPDYEQVLLMSNLSRDWSYSLTVEFQGTLLDRLTFQTGYSYSRSYDQMSLVFADMVSNFGFTPTASHPNQTPLRKSSFDRPHKVVASVQGAPFPGLERTRISLLYTGQSGAPFSYVYGGDLNGDGYPGLGPAFDRFNDLLYVPERASEVPSGFATLALLGHALENDECLARHRGGILPRNACRSPWQNRLDLRVTQDLDIGSGRLRLEADLVNVLSLLGTGWGRVETIRSVVPLLDVRRAETLGGGVGDLVASWSGTVLPERTDEGRLVSSEPWTVATPDSQWQAQFGIRMTFGGR